MKRAIRSRSILKSMYMDFLGLNRIGPELLWTDQSGPGMMEWEDQVVVIGLALAPLDQFVVLILTLDGPTALAR